MAELNATINISIVPKTYDQLSAGQLGRCSERIKHNDKCVKCRLFGPALLGMPDMELLGIIRVMCETIDNKTNDRKFYLQNRHTVVGQNWSTNRDLQTKLDADNAI